MQPTFLTRFVLGVLGLGLNLFAVGPGVTRLAGEFAGNMTYLGVRVALIVGLAAALIRVSDGRRIQAVSMTAFAVFIEHTALKALWMALERQSNPTAWQGLGMTDVLYGLLLGFMAFLPIVLLLGWIGTEVGKALPRRQPASAPGPGPGENAGV